MVGLRSHAKFELIVLRRNKSRYEVAEEILPHMSTSLLDENMWKAREKPVNFPVKKPMKY